MRTDANGNQRWTIRGALARPDDLPAVRLANGDQFWYVPNPKRGMPGQRSELPHRDLGPAAVYASGKEVWFSMGKVHRLDGPAVSEPSGAQSWQLEGKLHRIGGPASIDAAGNLGWYEEGRLHREDGPAIEMANGSRMWFLKGALQRCEFVTRPWESPLVLPPATTPARGIVTADEAGITLKITPYPGRAGENVIRLVGQGTTLLIFCARDEHLPVVEADVRVLATLPDAQCHELLASWKHLDTPYTSRRLADNIATKAPVASLGGPQIRKQRDMPSAASRGDGRLRRARELPTPIRGVVAEQPQQALF